MQVQSQEQALERLIELQIEDGGIPTQPAWADTIETEDGWAFFNVNGYLGTVTEDSEFFDEPQFAENE